MAADFYQVSITSMQVGETADSSVGNLAVPTELSGYVAADSWQEAVQQVVRGTVTLENSDVIEFPTSGRFAVGTVAELDSAYSGFDLDDPSYGLASDTKLIVMEDLTDNDYDDNYWVVTVNVATTDIGVGVEAVDPTAFEGLDSSGRNGQYRFFRDSSAVGTAVTIRYAISGTATPGDDYTTLAGTITLGASEYEKFVDVVPQDDTKIEGDETVIVTILTESSDPYGATPGYEAATVTIEDDDKKSEEPKPDDPCDCECDCSVANTSQQGGSETTAPGGETGYNGTTNPHPIVRLNYELPVGLAVPDLLEVQLTLGGIVGDTVYYDPSGLSAGDEVVLALQVDASTLSTGRYAWEIKITSQRGLDTSDRTYKGVQDVINRAGSEFGKGWFHNSLDRLLIDSAGVNLITGDNRALWFESVGDGYVREEGELGFSSLVQNGNGTFTLTAADGTRKEFDASGLLTATVDRNENVTSYTYLDADGDSIADELSEITDHVGRTTTFTYANGLVASSEGFAGNVTTYAYNLDNRLIKVTEPDPDGLGPQTSPETEYVYEAGTGLLQTIINPRDLESTFTYDHARRVSSIEKPCGGTTELSSFQSSGVVDLSVIGYDSAHPAPLVVASSVVEISEDELGNATTIVRDRFGYIVSSTDALGNTTLYERNADGLVTKLTEPDPDGAGPLASVHTTFAYDARGNLILQTNGDGSTQSWTYDAVYSVVTSHTDELNRRTLYTIDPANGNVLAQREVVGQVDSVGNGETDDVITTYTYTDGLGVAPAGLVETMTDPRGYVTQYQYDPRGLVETITAALGTAEETSEQFEYDSADNLTATIDGLGRRTEYAYDALDRLIAVTQPDPDGAGPLASPVTQYRYDASGNQTHVIDALGNTTEYVYDERNRVEQMIEADPDGAGPLAAPVTSYTYDCVGNLLSVTDPLGRVTNYEYDALNRLEQQLDPDPDGSGPLARPVTTYLYDRASRLMSQVDAAGTITSYSYDLRGRQIAVTTATAAGLLGEYYQPGGLVTDFPNYDTLSPAETRLDGQVNFPSTEGEFGGLDGFVDDFAVRWTGAVYLADSGPITFHLSSDDGSRLYINGQLVVDNGGMHGFLEASGTVNLGAGYHDIRVEFFERSFGAGVVLSYTPAGEAKQVIPASALFQVSRSTVTYDLADQVVMTTDPLGRHTRYTYDDLGRQTGVRRPNPDTTTPVTIIDNGDSGYSTTGAWTESSTVPTEHRPYYEGDHASHAPGSSSDAATWTFTDLEPGIYRVATHWVAYGNRATDASYSVDDGTLTHTWIVNQREEPGDFTAAGVPWEYLGETFTVTAGTLAVSLRSGTDGYVIADAVRLERVEAFGPTATTQYDAAGNVVASTDELGNTTTFVYDALGRMIESVLPDPDGAGPQASPVWSSTYDDAGQLLTRTDALGRVTSYAYDGLGRQTAVTQPDPDGAGPQTSPVWQYAYDALGNLLTATDPLGNATAYEYDDLQRLVSVTQPDPDGAGPLTSPVTSYAYDSAGQNVSVTDPLQRVTQYQYDALGRMTKVTLPDPDGLGPQTAPEEQREYDILSRLMRAVDANGNITQYAYDLAGRQTVVTRYADAGLQGEYFAIGGLVEDFPDYDALTATHTQLDGQVNFASTETDFNGLAGLVDDFAARWTGAIEIAAAGEVTFYLASDDGSRLYIDGELVVDNGGLHGFIEASGTITLSEGYHDIRVEFFERSGGAGVVLSYTPVGGTKQVVPAAALTQFNRTEMAYDAAGQTTAVTDALGGVTHYEYDGLGRTTKVTSPDPDGAGAQLAPRITYTYDAVGNLLTTTDRLGHATTNAYDDLYRQTSVTNANGEATSYAYDPVGNLLTLTDPEDNATAWAYDGLDRVSTETNELSAVRSFEYDAASNLVKKTDRLGRVTEFVHDNLHRRTAEVWKDGGSTVRTLSWEYDAANQLTSASDPAAAYDYVYDELGRATSISGDISGLTPEVVLSQAFDAVGNRTQLAAEIGGVDDFVSDFTYDRLHRLTRLTQQGQSGGNAVAEQRFDFGYNALGQQALLTRYADLIGNEMVATTTYGYDNAHRLTSLLHKQGITALAGYDYAYDAANRITSIDSLIDGLSQYNHDDAGQLTDADHTGQTDEAYLYDDNGNRIMTGYVVGANNKISSDGTYTYEYDAEGNLTAMETIATGEREEYEWDHRNRLVGVTFKDSLGAVTQSVEQAYDVFNRWVRRTVDNVDTFFVYDGNQIILEFAGDEAADLSNRYVWSNQVDQLLSVEQVTSLAAAGGVIYALTDHLGTTRDLVTYDTGTNVASIASHRFFDSFGNLVSETNASVTILIGFTGRPFDDATGKQWNLNRWYISHLGVWMSEDPIGFEGGDVNIRRYASNNSMLRIDSNGMESTDLIHSTEPNKVAPILKNGFKGTLWLGTQNSPAGGGKAWQAKNSAKIHMRIDDSVLSSARVVPDSLMKDWFAEGYAKTGTQAGADAYRYQKLNEYIEKSSDVVFKVKKKQGSHYAIKEPAIRNAKPLLTRVEGVRLSGDEIADPILLNRLGKTKANTARMFARSGGRILVGVGIAADIYDLYTAEDFTRELVTKCYGWEGAWIGGWTGAAIAGAGGQMGPQIAAPEEVITVPLGTLLGAIAGYNIGCEVGETIYDWQVENGYYLY